MRKMVFGLAAGVVLMALAGCADDAPTARAQAEVASTLPNAPSGIVTPPLQTKTIIGPDGNTIQCTSYGGGFCVQR